MDQQQLQDIVDVIVGKRPLAGRNPFELVTAICRKKFPADCMAIIEPLLHVTDGVTYKYAIDMVGNLKGASGEASDAIEAAWERSWQHGVPQACEEAFRALLRIGDNDERLLAMINRSMAVDNYGIHKLCAETLMKIDGGDNLLQDWPQTIAGQCDCHLHKKLAAKIAKYLDAA